MENTSYLKQLQLHTQSIENALKGCEIDIDYHKKILEMAEEHKKNLLESLEIANQSIALEEQQDGKA